MTQMLAMRKNAKNINPLAGSWACSTTVMAFVFGPTSDPLISCPVEQIDMWVQTWSGACSQEDRHDTRFTWQRNLITYLSNGKPARSMGPIAGTINALLLTGWRPSRPDLWHVDAETLIRVDGKPFSRFQIIAQAQNDLQKRAWERAAKHEHGQGLETGIPSFAAIRRTLKYLRNNGYVAEARALEFVVV